jgi:hypothetical protein
MRLTLRRRLGSLTVRSIRPDRLFRAREAPGCGLIEINKAHHSSAAPNPRRPPNFRPAWRAKMVVLTTNPTDKNFGQTQKGRILYRRLLGLCIMGAATLGAQGASAQDCFLFFCQGVARASPYSGLPPAPSPVGPRERTAPLVGASPDREYPAMYAPVAGEPFPVPGVTLPDIDPAFLRQAIWFKAGDARSATASASGGRGSVGPASPPSTTCRNGRTGTRPKR